jgi:ABC-type branched-subunit amino acid transport system permease subunit
VRPAWLRPAGVAALAIAVLGLPLVAGDPATVNIGVFTLMYVGLATAWNVMGGYTGYISLGHAGFFGIGAYALGLFVDRLGGVNPGILEAIAARIRDLNASGTTFLIVEHDMGFVMGLCSTVLVLDRGRTIACGTPAEVRADPAVLEANLGA